MKPRVFFVCLYATSLLLLFSTCKNESRTYTIDDVTKDTLITGSNYDYKNSLALEERINKIFNKYIYSGKSDVKATYNVISICIGSIELYAGELPEWRPHEQNKGPIVFRNHWRQIERLYLKVLAATRKAIMDHPNSSGLYNHSANIKCTINDLHGAIQDMLIAINLRPTDEDYHQSLGYFYEFNNEFSKACEYLRKARDLGAEIRQSEIDEVCDN